MTLTVQQESALNAIRSFINDTEASVFILKGYAGTGKTTMIQSIIQDVKLTRPHYVLMAPTGRAAKMLREKTGQNASTIHRVIYNFDKMDVTDLDENGISVDTDTNNDDKQPNKTMGVDSMHLWFKIKTSDEEHSPNKTLYIVDEASMISSIRSCGEMLHFGSDVLLDDLMAFIQPFKGGKILFIGDPAQLPPVGDNKSAALDEQYFVNRGLKVISAELTEVVRQSGESTILKNAMQIRDLIKSKVRNSISFERSTDVVDITAADVANRFCRIISSPSIGESVVICYSNSKVKDYNDAIRANYFPDASNIVAGDILQIVKNNVGSNNGTDMFNGDFAKVLSVSDNTEALSAPVWADLGKGRERISISVSFRDVVLQLEDGTQVSCKIIDDLLNNRERNLSPLQTLALFINFKMRFHDSIKETRLTASEKKEAFNNALRSDPYYNAVQAKYGYAITAHKSQGGEWKTVFVDYTGRTGLNDESLRWCYTATTRPIETLYGINFPSATPLSKLKINPIIKYSKPAKEAFSFGAITSDRVMPAAATSAQKAKFNCIQENLSHLGVLIERIELLQYIDRYHIQSSCGEIIVDCQYNGTGMYTSYRSQNQNILTDKVLDCFKDESKIEYEFKYTPSSNQMSVLYKLMISICDDLEIMITNIVEHSSQYYVAYYMKTSCCFSQILFYFKNNGYITHALPSSSLGTADLKLVALIDNICRKSECIG